MHMGLVMSLPVFSLMLVVFSLTTGEFVIAGILPEVADDLSVSIPAAGLLVTAYASGMIVGGPVVTVLTARLARKPLIVGLIVVSVIGNLGSAVAPGYSVLLVSRFVAAWSWRRSSLSRSAPPCRWPPRVSKPPPWRR